MTNTVIIGASAAGLACAAQLKRAGVSYRLLEKHDHVAHAWRNHYERLHLHTHKGSSHLPFKKFPQSSAKYPSRREVVRYLEAYGDDLQLNPELKTEVIHVNPSAHGWEIVTVNEMIQTKHVIFCTGNTNLPKMVKKPGLESFEGTIIHSSSYRNGKAFKDKKVLVIGFGNSACEIAICLSEHGAKPALSVRGEVNVIPRDILGIPVLQIGIAQAKLPAKLVDTLNKPLLHLLIGDITKLGLKKAPYGPIEQIRKYHKIPLLNIGTIELIKSGDIQVYGDIENIQKNEITFEGNKAAHFDAIVMATGYETGLSNLIDLNEARLDDIQIDITKRRFLGKDGLYFCGFYVSPTGMLREMKIESEIIAKSILGNA